VSLTAIQDAVASYYGVTISELKSPGRAARITWPRQVAIHLSHELTDTPLSSIGKAFGGRNHATVLHACKRVEARVSKDQEAVHDLDELREMLRQGRHDRGS
jgi:chromosomal replication initiator protein